LRTLVAPEAGLRRIEAQLRDEGGPPSRLRYRLRALELIRDEGLYAPAYSFRIVPIDAVEQDGLRAGGELLDASRLIPETGDLTALCCVAVTIGGSLGPRVSALFAERRVSLALATDDIGNRLLMDLSRWTDDKLLGTVKKRGLTMAGELRPGDPGMRMSDQAALLRLADAASIGMSVAAGGSLLPLKSTSAVFGVGTDLPMAQWSRCDSCPSRPRCRVARAAEAAREPA